MIFPPPHTADLETGLLGVGGTLNKNTLLQSYTQGIFPWPHEGYPLLWFSPHKRAILEFKDLHISSRLKKYFSKMNLDFSVNTQFKNVIERCASMKRKGQDGTWINSKMKKAYLELHENGLATSFEASEKGKLVAGLYGVHLGNYFCGESMFHEMDHASKWLITRIAFYLKEKGSEWMDIQVMTPHMKNLGAKEISQKEFLKRLNEELRAAGLSEVL